jgi:hypothetical protein
MNKTLARDLNMNTLLLKLAVTAAVTCLLTSNLMAAQVSPTIPRAAHVRVTEGPAIEMTKECVTIVRWTANNPGGSPEHYGVVHYGTDPKNLSETAKSPIRLNPDHASTVFRVRLDNLKPRTTYYYTVSSEEANGRDDGAKSAVKQFTTLGESQRAGRSRNGTLESGPACLWCFDDIRICLAPGILLKELELPQSYGPFLSFETTPLLYTHPSTARSAFDELTESSRHLGRGGARQWHTTRRQSTGLLEFRKMTADRGSVISTAIAVRW